MKYTSPEEQKIEDLKSQKYVEEAPYHPGYEDAVVQDSDGKPLSQVLRENMRITGKRFWAGDNISEFVNGVSPKPQNPYIFQRGL